MKAELREMMKNQTIGVEVEMNNITREDAARVAANYFGTGRVYNKGGVYRVWSAYDASGREWKFEYDSSIHGDDNHKCEMATPILRYEDIELLQGLIRVLREAGAKSNPRRGCGVHIHIGADGHTPETLRNLANIMASHESLLIRSIGIAESRTGQWCRTIDHRFLEMLNQKKPKTMDDFFDVWYVSQGCDYGRTAHYNSSRYHMLNYHATNTKGTIEFRLFQFDNYNRGCKGAGLHAGKLKSYIQLCLALSNYAKVVKWAKPEEPPANFENPKYVMRFWLKTMGMTGPEFKTARDFLMFKLDGNSDCRTGNRENCHHRDQEAA